MAGVYSIYSMYIYWSVIIQATLGLNYLDLWQVRIHLSMLASAVLSWVWVSVFVTVIALLLITHKLWELVDVLLSLCSHQPFCSLVL